MWDGARLLRLELDDTSGQTSKERASQHTIASQKAISETAADATAGDNRDFGGEVEGGGSGQSREVGGGEVLFGRAQHAWKKPDYFCRLVLTQSETQHGGQLIPHQPVGRREAAVRNGSDCETGLNPLTVQHKHKHTLIFIQTHWLNLLTAQYSTSSTTVITIKHREPCC